MQLKRKDRKKRSGLHRKKISLYLWLINAGIAQLVEHNLAKVGVASSSLVFRSTIYRHFLFMLHALPSLPPMVRHFF